MKNTSCDHCGRKFTKTDDYIGARLALSYAQYEGDDGSTSVRKNEELCGECLAAVNRFLAKRRRSR